MILAANVILIINVIFTDKILELFPKIPINHHSVWFVWKLEEEIFFAFSRKLEIPMKFAGTNLRVDLRKEAFLGFTFMG